jgi:iron complex outermembrane receptor protein
VRASAVAFTRRERDVIDYVRRSASEIWRATNFQRLRFSGIELSAATRMPGAQELEFHYTGLHGAREALAGFESKYVFNYPVHSGIVAWMAHPRNSVLVRTRVGVLERLSRDPYAVWDLYAAATRSRLRPFVQFTNIGNTAYEEIPRVPMPGRGIVAGVEIVAWTAR